VADTPTRAPDSISVALSRVGAREVDAAEYAGAFPYLDPGQLAKLQPFGREQGVAAGDVLFTEGQLNPDFIVVLEGELLAVAHYGPTGDPVSTPFKPGQFVGVMNILSGEGAYVTVTATETSRVIRVPLDRLRDLLGADIAISETILRAFLLRHSLLMRLGKLCEERLADEGHATIAYQLALKADPGLWYPQAWLILDEGEQKGLASSVVETVEGAASSVKQATTSSASPVFRPHA